ncbi:hypothetical protein PHYPO_G00164420 [Pangasianodon hypophthalmus]|uniref:Uncharacterized protein n=1 Tax=Pangasianodon hypophthalmus TaxID=310915 RepID=A0A5N5JK73_PANHP|nr:hypothetical protein PHYPO_G00164420 [Pangasianodon hypophthalmus]
MPVPKSMASDRLEFYGGIFGGLIPLGGKDGLGRSRARVPTDGEKKERFWRKSRQNQRVRKKLRRIC